MCIVWSFPSRSLFSTFIAFRWGSVDKVSPICKVISLCRHYRFVLAAVTFAAYQLQIVNTERHIRVIDVVSRQIYFMVDDLADAPAALA